MKGLTFGVLGLAWLGAAFLIPSTSGAIQVPAKPLEEARSGAIIEVRQNRCANWHRICVNRWGHGWRYRRCMAVHGCFAYRHK